jgi:hypothetical protein
MLYGKKNKMRRKEGKIQSIKILPSMLLDNRIDANNNNDFSIKLFHLTIFMMIKNKYYQTKLAFNPQKTFLFFVRNANVLHISNSNEEFKKKFY